MKTSIVDERRLVVLDSSVGVKWIKPEPGRADAIGLLAEHREGRIRLVVPAHFIHEVVGVAVRHGGPERGETTWASLRNSDLTVVGLDDTLAAAAFDQCRLLGCSFYDALAPALAERLGATLFSADARAHARFAGIVLIGQA
ncbi:MAG: type II toxin-antitoxin system VapC family toxin [Coriobacteriia bacterium]|nr:type II toxin-antitoxin system VapC family toxin [Coriobacteriia bacterium]